MSITLKAILILFL